MFAREYRGYVIQFGSITKKGHPVFITRDALSDSDTEIFKRGEALVDNLLDAKPPLHRTAINHLAFLDTYPPETCPDCDCELMPCKWCGEPMTLRRLEGMWHEGKCYRCCMNVEEVCPSHADMEFDETTGREQMRQRNRSLMGL